MANGDAWKQTTRYHAVPTTEKMSLLSNWVGDVVTHLTVIHHQHHCRHDEYPSRSHYHLHQSSWLAQEWICPPCISGSFHKLIHISSQQAAGNSCSRCQQQCACQWSSSDPLEAQLIHLPHCWIDKPSHVGSEKPLTVAHHSWPSGSGNGDNCRSAHPAVSNIVDPLVSLVLVLVIPP